MKEGKPTTKVVRPLRNGQITIPISFRKQLGIDADSLLQITLAQGELRIRPIRATQAVGGSPWLKDLYDYFAPVRAEAEAEQYSEGEIDAAIEQAVKAVRAKHA